MRRRTVLWEPLVTRFEDVWDRHKKRRLTAEEAGELLGMSARLFPAVAGATRTPARTVCATAGWAAYWDRAAGG